MTRYLGIDYGGKRIGIAISDFDNKLAFAHKQIDAAEGKTKLAKIINENEITHIVVGLPLQMDGSEGESAAAARKFATTLPASAQIIFQDERLSSSAAEKSLIRDFDLSRAKRKDVLDKLAAQSILQAYLDKIARAEYLDILDENGAPTGEKKLRSDVHRDGDLHKAVIAAIINSNGEILLQKRARHKDKFADLWDISISGHVQSGATPEQALIKEAAEEIGIKITPRDLHPIATFLSKITIGDMKENEFHDLFMIRLDHPISAYSPKDGEVSEIKFVNIAELKNLGQKGELTPRTQWIKLIEEFLQ
ncbi:MAG: Holliday junction resolvase RuvX [Alphaproteobacteria bacterium]|nr:Holliday junction resolvase RuvX [Alphaproteobacteria bacterium]